MLVKKKRRRKINVLLLRFLNLCLWVFKVRRGKVRRKCILCKSLSFLFSISTVFIRWRAKSVSLQRGKTAVCHRTPSLTPSPSPPLILQPLHSPFLLRRWQLSAFLAYNLKWTYCLNFLSSCWSRRSGFSKRSVLLMFLTILTCITVHVCYSSKCPFSWPFHSSCPLSLSLFTLAALSKL